MAKSSPPPAHTKKHAAGSGKKHPKHAPAAKHHPKSTKGGGGSAGKPGSGDTMTPGGGSGGGVVKPPAHPKPRKAPLISDQVACCAAEAVAASLRLTGHPVTDADVLALYWHTTTDPDAGATIPDTLAAAAEYGIAGVRPAAYWPTLQLTEGTVAGLTLTRGEHAVAVTTGGVMTWGSFLRFGGQLLAAACDEAWGISWS